MKKLNAEHIFLMSFTLFALSTFASGEGRRGWVIPTSAPREMTRVSHLPKLPNQFMEAGTIVYTERKKEQCFYVLQRKPDTVGRGKFGSAITVINQEWMPCDIDGKPLS